MNYKGLYINLDRSTDRHEYIEGELARNNLRGYQRFVATDGNALGFPQGRLTDGELGCFTSHYLAMIKNLDSDLPIHIIEDDIVLSEYVEPVLDNVLGSFSPFDIIYTDISVPVDVHLCRTYKNFYEAPERGNISNIQLLDLKGVLSGSTCSYVVNPRSLNKITSLLKNELDRGASLPIDIFLRDLCWRGEIRMHCLFPFITSIVPGNKSTMTGRFAALPALASDVLRHSFFIKSDIAQVLDDAERLFPQPRAADLHRQLISKLLNYSLIQTEESP